MSFHPTFRAKGLYLAAIFGAVACISACGSEESTPATGSAGGSAGSGGAAGAAGTGGIAGSTGGMAGSTGGAAGTTGGAAGTTGGAAGTTGGAAGITGGAAGTTGGAAGSTGGAAGSTGGASGTGGTGGTGGTAGTGGTGGVSGSGGTGGTGGASGTGGTGGVSGTGGAGGTTDGGVSTGKFTARRWFSSENSPLNNVTPAGTSVWNTGPQPLTYKMDEQGQVPITVPGGSATTKIDVDPATTFQTMLGFGISMEESSVANIRKLSAAKRTEILTSIVDPVNGMGQNLFRITMGTSDFTGQPWYSYDDGAADATMSRFSIQKDIDAGIIDVLKQMLAINPDVKFFGSVWSPPGWMKDSGTMLGGNFQSANIAAHALYFRKFVEAYKAQGVPIYAVTLQNEPQHTINSYPTCIISAAQEVDLVQQVKQQFTAGGLDTKVWVFDHNFDIGVAYSTTIMNNAGAAAATDGVAWHDYGGDPSAMTTFHNAFPNKDIFFTEKTLWGVAGVERAAQYIRNWSKSYVSWLTMLDQDGKPNNGPNTGKVRRFVKSTTNTTAGEYWPTAEHWLFGLYSKFVKRDAKRIQSTLGSAATVTSIAFLNPDNSVVTLIMNQSATTQQFAIASEGNQIWSQVPAKTAATYVWSKGLGTATAAAVAPTN